MEPHAATCDYNEYASIQCRDIKLEPSTNAFLVFPTDTYSLSSQPSSAYNADDHMRQCHCVIDLSTPTSLERDFYAWLNGMETHGCRNSSCCLLAGSSTLLPHEMNVGIIGSTGAHHITTSPSSSGMDSNSSASSISPTTSSDGSCMMGLLSSANEMYGKSRMRRKRNITKGRGTNLYGRPYCPGRPLNLELRSSIISLFHSGMKVNAISKQLAISHGCVSKIITRFRETGLLMPSSHSECRRRRRVQQVKIENG
ncbi:Paired box domain-containing protein [Ditylenchus destructor]|nr:Paired box domain-containing protein [Ditylenchus destructor]